METKYMSIIYFVNENYVPLNIPYFVLAATLAPKSKAAADCRHLCCPSGKSLQL